VEEEEEEDKRQADCKDMSSGAKGGSSGAMNSLTRKMLGRVRELLEGEPGNKIPDVDKIAEMLCTTWASRTILRKSHLLHDGCLLMR
jgi:hypothetical protein